MKKNRLLHNRHFRNVRQGINSIGRHLPDELIDNIGRRLTHSPIRVEPQILFSNDYTSNGRFDPLSSPERYGNTEFDFRRKLERDLSEGVDRSKLKVETDMRRVIPPSADEPEVGRAIRIHYYGNNEEDPEYDRALINYHNGIDPGDLADEDFHIDFDWRDHDAWNYGQYTANMDRADPWQERGNSGELERDLREGYEAPPSGPAFNTRSKRRRIDARAGVRQT